MMILELLLLLITHIVTIDNYYILVISSYKHATIFFFVFKQILMFSKYLKLLK